MKLIFKYVKPWMYAVILGPLFMLGEVLTDLMQPKLMASIIDFGIKNGDTTYIVWTCLQMIGYAFLGIIGGAGCIYFSSIAGYNFAASLRKSLYKKIQSFSFANIDKFKTGSLVTRITNDVTQVQNALQASLRILVRAPLLAIGGIIMAIVINAKLAIVLLFSIPLQIGIIVLLITKGFPLFKIVQEKLDSVNTVMQENLAGVRVIKAFGRSVYEMKRFGKANDSLLKINIKAGRVMSIAFPAIILVMNLTIVAVIWFGGNLAWAGGIAVGEIMAFITYVFQILFSLMMSSFMLLNVSRAKASIDRLEEVLETVPDITNPTNPEEHIVTDGKVEFCDVSFSYPGQDGDSVLKNINFVAQPGKTIAVLGSTGSGKTSLVSLIPRLYDVTSGKVLIDGVDVRDYAIADLRSGIGVALQESVLFSGTVAENLRWGDENAPISVLVDAAVAAQAHGFIGELSDGYESVIGQRGVNLSGGQKQRLSIARALVKAPKILILDDSTSAVDLNTEAEIQKAMRKVMGKCTVFIIAQRISSVMDADSIIVLDDGNLMDMGTHEELLARCDVYREIVISQLGKEAI